MTEYSFQKGGYLIIGLGVSGRSAATFLLNQGARVIGVDSNRNLLQEHPGIKELQGKGLSVLYESEALDFDSFHTVVVSPGVSRQQPLYRQAREMGKEIIGEVELACRHLNNTFLGITGTNGKTTVSLLVGHVLNSAGKKAAVLGNSGVPLTSEIGNQDGKIIVCELSSYQLETMRSKVIDVAGILNITPDHLDRYESMNDYAKAKVHISRCLKEQGKLFINEKVGRDYPHLTAGLKASWVGFSLNCEVRSDKSSIYSKEILELILPDHYRGKSSHDVENIMMAYALCSEMGVSPECFAQALATFGKPPHRIEFVRSLNGIAFYNDSKGTNVDAVNRAVEAMPGDVVLIAGGQSKGMTFTPWLTMLGDKVKRICAIGEAKKQLIEELSKKYRVIGCESMDIAVKYAFAVAEEGDNVLLSPGCASYDMFRNYEHRGDCFKEIVNGLKG